MSSISRIPVHACSDVAVSFSLPDGTITHRRGRTMDFLTPMGSHIVNYKAQGTSSSFAPGKDMGGWYADGEKGFSWENKFNFLGITALGSNCVDGINEMGFTGGALTLNNTQFQTVHGEESKIALAAKDILNYLFATCITVDDAKKALHEVKVWRCTLDDRAEIPMPLLHMSVHDDQGGNGVIEYRKGKLKFYEGTPGILTNDPIYPSQLDGLRNYNTFNPDYGLKPMVVNGVAIPSFGDIGNRSVGMPGSTSPIDRFVRLHLNVAQMHPPRDSTDATNRIWNLLYNVWAQPGSEIIPLGSYKIDAFTRWALNIDIGERSISWITDRNRTPQTVKLSDFDFSPDAPEIRIPLGAPEEVKFWEADLAEYISTSLAHHSSPASSSEAL